MDVPFTVKFLATFEQLNRSLWPLHLVSYGLAATVIVHVVTRSINSRVVYGSLAVLWTFAAVVFHWMYFRPIARSGRLFAIVFAMQAALFVREAFHPRTVFRLQGNLPSWYGLALVTFSAVGYPIAGYLLRGSLTQVAWLGVFPCPLALFTLGLFLTAVRLVPKYLLIVPTLWAAAGVVPVSWGVSEDYVLVIGGLVATGLILYRDRQPPAAAVKHVVTA